MKLNFWIVLLLVISFASWFRSRSQTNQDVVPVVGGFTTTTYPNSTESVDEMRQENDESMQEFSDQINQFFANISSGSGTSPQATPISRLQMNQQYEPHISNFQVSSAMNGLMIGNTQPLTNLFNTMIDIGKFMLFQNKT